MTENWTTKTGWTPKAGEYVYITEDHYGLSKGDVVKVVWANSEGGVFRGENGSNDLLPDKIARIVPGGTKLPGGAKCVRVAPGALRHGHPRRAIDVLYDAGDAYAVLSDPVDPRRAELERLANAAVLASAKAQKAAADAEEALAAYLNGGDHD